MVRRVLHVPDMSCGHCEMTVTHALRRMGADEVKVDLQRKEVEVAFDPARVSEERLLAALKEEGYPVQAVRPA